MMNELIKKLAERAGMLFDQRDQPLWVALDQVDKGVFLIEYAELIVKECAQFVEDTFDFVGEEIIVKEKMLEHFGVES